MKRLSYAFACENVNWRERVEHALGITHRTSGQTLCDIRWYARSCSKAVQTIELNCARWTLINELGESKTTEGKPRRNSVWNKTRKASPI